MLRHIAQPGDTMYSCPMMMIGMASTADRSGKSRANMTPDDWPLSQYLGHLFEEV